MGITAQKVHEYIKTYINLGWVVVLQGATADGSFKKPLGEWKQYNQDVISKPTFDDVIRQSVAFRGQVKGVGAISGKHSGFVVLDFDSYKENSENDELKKILDEVETPVSLTGGGGYHYFFKYNPKIKTTANIACGVDTRGIGGNVVLPPSLHKSGKRYEWLISPEDVELAEMPEKLINFLAKKVPEKVNKIEIANGFDFSKFYEKGERDEAVTRGAMSLIKILPKHRWLRDGFSLFKAWAYSHITDNSDNYITDNLLKVKYESAIKKQTVDLPDNLNVVELLSNSNVVDEIFRSDRTKGIKTGYDYFDLKTGGVLSGGLTVISAQTGVGKSLFFMNILENISKSKKVAYLDLENGVSETLERILRIKHNLNKSFFLDSQNKDKIKSLLDGNLYNYLYYAVDQQVRKPDILFNTLNILVEKGVEVIAIDPLQQIEGGDEFEMQGRLVIKLSDFAKKNNIAILLCHHVRKSTTAGGKYYSDIDDVKEIQYLNPSLEDVKGGSIITDTAENVWLITRPFVSSDKLEKSKMVLKVVKCRSNGNALGVYRFYLNLDTLKIYEKIESLPYYLSVVDYSFNGKDLLNVSRN